MIRNLAWAAALTVVAAAATAQPQPLPVELSGRWTLPSPNRSQTFALKGIAPAGEGAFTATLTWWASDPRCTIQSVPITGRVTPTGIAFDARTPCDVAFTAELDRAQSGWQGKATTVSANPVELVLIAR